MDVLNTKTIVTFGIGILIGMLIISLFGKKDRDEHISSQLDTSYNKVKLDSINVQIGKHDTTIYKLNIKLKDDIEKSYQLNDSATVELFKRLVERTDSIR